MRELIIMSSSAAQAEGLAQMAEALAIAYGHANPEMNNDELINRIRCFVNDIQSFGTQAADITNSKIGKPRLRYPMSILWLKVHEECRRILLSNELIASVHNEMQ